MNINIFKKPERKIFMMRDEESRPWLFHLRSSLNHTHPSPAENERKKVSPANRSRTSDLKITVVSHLQSSALPTELSRARC